MVPLNCCFWEKGLDTGDGGELICFRRTPEQSAWYAEAEARLIPGHPPDCAWFCADHIEVVRPLVDLDLGQALATIRAQENEIR